jgi:hypothetical protein
MKVSVVPPPPPAFTNEYLPLVLESQNPSHIPLSTLRCERTKLFPYIASSRTRLSKLLGVSESSIAISYNLREILDALRVHSNIKEMEKRTYTDPGELDAKCPEDVGKYVECAVETMDRMGFGKDDMLRECWINAAPKGIRFEVGMKLKSVSYLLQGTVIADDE